MIIVKGQSNEEIVLDGEWFEKLRGGHSKTKMPASSFVSVEIKEFERKKKLFGGEKEALLQAVFTFSSPPFVGFITEAANKAQVEEIITGLEAARDSG